MQAMAEVQFSLSVFYLSYVSKCLLVSKNLFLVIERCRFTLNRGIKWLLNP